MCKYRKDIARRLPSSGSRRSVLALALLAALRRQHAAIAARAAFGRYRRMQLRAIRRRMRLIGVGPARPLPDPFLLRLQQRLDLRHRIFLADVLDRRLHRYGRYGFAYS